MAVTKGREPIKRDTWMVCIGAKCGPGLSPRQRAGPLTFGSRYHMTQITENLLLYLSITFLQHCLKSLFFCFPSSQNNSVQCQRSSEARTALLQPQLSCKISSGSLARHQLVFIYLIYGDGIAMRCLASVSTQ